MCHLFGYGYQYSWPLMLGFSAVRLLVAAGFIFLIVKLIKGNQGQVYSQSGGPLAILKEKYAKGEITEEEYQHKRNILK